MTNSRRVAKACPIGIFIPLAWSVVVIYRIVSQRLPVATVGRSGRGGIIRAVVFSVLGWMTYFSAGNLSTASAQSPAWSPQRWDDRDPDGEVVDLPSTRVAWPQPVRLDDRSASQMPPQAFPQTSPQTSTRTPSNPIRQSQLVADSDPYQDPYQDPYGDVPEIHAPPVTGGPSMAAPGEHWNPAAPATSHQVLRSPGYQGNAKLPNNSYPPRHALHPVFSPHRPIQPNAAVLPRGVQSRTWKTPYSYGYFGASGTRHWSKHFGYRDRSTQWRLW